DRGEELRGQLAVHRNAGLAVVLKPRRALEHDQRAVLRLTDEKSGSDEFVDDALHLLLGARREQAVEGAELSKLAQGAPQLRLEHDDQRDDGHGKQALQEQHREGQLEIGRDPVDEDEDQDTDEQLDRPGTADQDEDVVDEDRHDQDVECDVPFEDLPVQEVVELLDDAVHLIGPRQRLDLRGKVDAPVEQQGLHEELALRTGDFALSERTRDLDEQPLRIVIRDTGGDELEEQVRRRVGATVLQIASRGLEGELRGTRISRREIAGGG